MTTLNARLRPSEKGGVSVLRREGFIPAVVYGPTTDSTSIAIERKDLHALFSVITRSSRIDLAIADGRKKKKLDVFVKAIQYDPVTDEPIHVDFYHPDKGRALKLDVPLKIEGESPGVKAGGVLNVLFQAVPVHGLPKDIPHLLTIDVSSLNIGESIHVRDLDFGKVDPLLPSERTLVTVVAPRRVEEEEVVVPAEEAALKEGEEGAEEEPTTEPGEKTAEGD
jgi:large subunit ribosomal protein L25